MAVADEMQAKLAEWVVTEMSLIREPDSVTMRFVPLALAPFLHRAQTD